MQSILYLMQQRQVIINKKGNLMKKLFFILLCTFSFISVFSIKTYAEEDQIIQNDATGIPDKNLYQAILSELKKTKNETFTKAEAAGITELHINTEKKGKEISSFLGVEYLTGLKGLSITGNSVKDLKEISKLKSLTRLSIYESQLANVYGIEELTNLESLSLSVKNLEEVSGVEKLTNLRYLIINVDRLIHLPDMKTMTKLEPHYTSFSFCKLPEKELKAKLPGQLLNEPLWLQNQLKFQNIKKEVKITKPKRITAKTKKISGKVHKKAYVKLVLWGGKRLKKVRANQKGHFCFRKLNLKKYKGKKAFIIASMKDCYYNEMISVGIMQLKIKKR